MTQAPKTESFEIMTKPTPGFLIALLVENIVKKDGSVYTSADIARGSGVTPESLSKYRTERYKSITTDTAYAIAKFFKIHPAYFFAQTETEALNFIAQHMETKQAIEAITPIDPDIFPYGQKFVDTVRDNWHESQYPIVMRLFVSIAEQLADLPLPTDDKTINIKDHLPPNK